jgi:hypothetical protein
MKRTTELCFLVMALASLVLGSCSTLNLFTAPTNTPSAPTLPPIWTSTPLPPTATLRPTSKSFPTLIATQIPTAVIPQVTATTGGTPGIDSAEFVTDVTVPDGAAMGSGQAFTKTWRLRNNGTSIWTTAYALVFSQGTQMGAPSSSPLAKEVRPGETIDISVNLTAPTAKGTYTGNFMLRNSAGKLFGVGKGATGTIYVLINVSTSGSQVTPAGTVGPSPTPGTITPVTGGPTITAATLSVDKVSFSGVCPVRLNFTGVITSTGAGSYTYQLQAGASNPKFSFTLPPPQTAKYTNTGTNNLVITYYLDIESTVNGWARLSVIGGNTLESGQVNFSVTCQ